VPELDLYRQEIGRADVEAIAAAGAALADEAGGDVVLAGFSFGGSFALLAAAEEVLADRVAVVAVLGAYWDMAGFAQAAATGRSLVDGREVVWEPDPRAPGLLREQVVALAPPALAPQVAAALEDGPTPEDDGAAALVALAEHDDPRETAAIVAGLPPEVRERLAAVSPSAVAGRIRAPVVAIHDVDDPAVPYAESLRMARDLPGARVTAVELFQHVDLDTDRSLRELSGDLLATWRWTRAILAPQERPFGGLRPLEG
jgi:pimeloyl-ACP methyl ester carboxylesterase